MKISIYGFPVWDDSEELEGIDTAALEFDQNRLTDALAVSKQLRFEQAKKYAAEARARNFQPDHNCPVCAHGENLPAILRILANWKPLDSTFGARWING